MVSQLTHILLPRLHSLRLLPRCRLLPLSSTLRLGLRVALLLRLPPSLPVGLRGYPPLGPGRH